MGDDLEDDFKSDGEPQPARTGFKGSIDDDEFVSPMQLVTKCVAILNREVEQLKLLAQEGMLDASESRRLNEYLRTSVAIVKDLKLDEMKTLRDQLKDADPHELAAAALTASKILGIDYEKVNKTSPRAVAAGSFLKD